MAFFGRAYYNLLWLENLRGNNIPAHHWERINYRTICLESLFSMLKNLNQYLDKDSFLKISSETDSPEEFIERLDILDKELKRRCYLIVFELWRRLVKEKKSVSIICDELDKVVADYENKKDDTKLLDILMVVAEVLERNNIYQLKKEEIFERLSFFIAHDLENVIYTYIDKKIDDGFFEKPLSLLDLFTPYVKEKQPFNFLRLKVFLKKPLNMKNK
jgi:hypothetical protein